MAASSSDLSMPTSRAFTIMYDIGYTNAEWARTRVSIPKGRFSREKNAMNTIPRMISGTMIGRCGKVLHHSLALIIDSRHSDGSQSADDAATRQLTPPRIRLFFSASIRAASWKSS